MNNICIWTKWVLFLTLPEILFLCWKGAGRLESLVSFLSCCCCCFEHYPCVPVCEMGWTSKGDKVGRFLFNKVIVLFTVCCFTFIVSVYVFVHIKDFRVFELAMFFIHSVCPAKEVLVFESRRRKSNHTYGEVRKLPLN